MGEGGAGASYLAAQLSTTSACPLAEMVCSNHGHSLHKMTLVWHSAIRWPRDRALVIESIRQIENSAPSESQLA